MEKWMRRGLYTVLCLLLVVCVFMAYQNATSPVVQLADAASEMSVTSHRARVPVTIDGVWTPDSEAGCGFGYKVSEKRLGELEEKRFGALEDSSILMLCDDYLVDEKISVGAGIRAIARSSGLKS